MKKFDEKFNSIISECKVVSESAENELHAYYAQEEFEEQVENFIEELGVEEVEKHSIVDAFHEKTLRVYGQPVFDANYIEDYLFEQLEEADIKLV